MKMMTTSPWKHLRMRIEDTAIAGIAGSGMIEGRRFGTPSRTSLLRVSFVVANDHVHVLNVCTRKGIISLHQLFPICLIANSLGRYKPT